MVLNEQTASTLERFIQESKFATTGGVITDLDGTAVHEFDGNVIIPQEVELALLRHYKDGRPVVLNSLRFPLSVIRTFGRDWYKLSNSPIPTVCLNGSLLGYIRSTESEELVFEEIASFPLSTQEISTTIAVVSKMVGDGFKNLLLFYYPRDWRIGEVIWTPIPENVIAVKEKYLSASAVTAVELSKLLSQMLSEDICMIFLLIDVPEDQLMAYQHTRSSNFITREGVDKLSGASAMAKALNFEIEHSIGAGDTEMDRFLSGVGLAAIVGGAMLPFKGQRSTVELKNSTELGAFLFRASELAARVT